MSEKVMEVELNDGLKVPTVGFGTYTLNGMDGVKIIKSAIDVGY